MVWRRGNRVLARDQSASLDDWQKLARTGEIVWFYNGRDRKKTGKIVRNGHFGRAVSESWLNPCVVISRCLCKKIMQGTVSWRKTREVTYKWSALDFNNSHRAAEDYQRWENIVVDVIIIVLTTLVV